MNEETMKSCIIYYSYEGNTKVIADTLAGSLGCDVFRIEPKKAFNSKGLMKFVWGGKQAMMKEKPELLPFDFDLNQYDSVIIGSPVWSWTIAPAIRTLCEDYLKHKDVFLFYTHEGGDQGVISKAKELLEKDNRLLETQGFLNVLKNQETNMKCAQEWAKKIKVNLK